MPCRFYEPPSNDRMYNPIYELAACLYFCLLSLRSFLSLSLSPLFSFPPYLLTCLVTPMQHRGWFFTVSCGVTDRLFVADGFFTSPVSLFHRRMNERLRPGFTSSFFERSSLSSLFLFIISFVEIQFLRLVFIYSYYLYRNYFLLLIFVYHYLIQIHALSLILHVNYYP